MEIIAEIRQQEYRQVIKDYYLNKDWTKRVAVLALISLGLALLSIINYNYPYKGRMIYGFFTSYFLIIYLFFFALPYGIRYLRMRKAIRLMARQPAEWAFNISEVGIHTKNNNKVRYYPWTMVENILIGGQHVVFKPAVGQVFCLPSASLDENSKMILANINTYRRKPVKERITSST